MLKIYFYILLSASLHYIRISYAANILFLVGVASPSHHIWNKVIMEALSNRGHNLTILTVEHEYSTINMNFILMENVYEAIYEEFLNLDNDVVDFTQKNVFSTIMEMYGFYGFVDKTLIKTQGVQELLNYPMDFKFDLILYDFTQCQVLLGFVDRFQYPPLIAISPFNIPPYTYTVTGSPVFPSFMPHPNGRYTYKMGFYERGWNFLYHAFDWFYRRFIYMVNENRKARKLFGPQIPSLEEIEKHTHLALVNLDFSIDYPQLLPPNVIPVGGLQIARQETLPVSIQQLLDTSENGVIYFSLGTNIQSSYLGKDKINMFIEVIRKLSMYDFIWKYEDDDLENLPDNLLIVKWCPQNAILPHHNLKLFMTHGGLLSVQESTWYGVPMLGIPFFMDQHQNMKKVVINGFGVTVDIFTVTVTELEENIIRIINEPWYRNNATKRSKLFRNQPMHPLQRAIFAIESLLENGGAEHLRLPMIDMPFWKIYMFDVLAAVLIVIIGFIFIIKNHIKIEPNKVNNGNQSINENDQKIETENEKKKN